MQFCLTVSYRLAVSVDLVVVMSSLDLLSAILYHYVIISIRVVYMLVFSGSIYHVKPCNVEVLSSSEQDEVS
jgi:hypothetical protein